MKKNWILPAAIISGLVLIPLLIFAGTMTFRYFTADARGQVEMEERVQSGDFRQHSYDHFYNLCVEVQSAQAEHEQQLRVLEGLESGTPQYNRAVRAEAAQRARIERLAREYNTDARREETVGQFRANDLPERIEMDELEEGGRVSCE